MTPADEIKTSLESMQALHRSIESMLVGRVVRVTSDHNGQPIGRSRKSWKGEIRRIKSVHVDVHWGVTLALEGHEYECFIPASEVEFV